MRKIFILSSLALLSACGQAPAQTSEAEKQPAALTMTYNPSLPHQSVDYAIITDQETGCQYFSFVRNGPAQIVPRMYNAGGAERQKGCKAPSSAGAK